MVEKNLKFIPNGRGSAFNLNFVLLLAEVDLVLEKQGCKRDILVAHGSGQIEKIFALITKVVTLYVQTLIIQVGVLGFRGSFLKSRVCLKLAILLALDK